MVRGQYASFMPIIMLAIGGLAIGGLAHEATVFYKCLVSLSYWLSGMINTLWSLVGFAAILGFLCSGQLFSAFEVHVHPLVFSIGLHHQWI